MVIWSFAFTERISSLRKTSGGKQRFAFRTPRETRESLGVYEKKQGGFMALGFRRALTVALSSPGRVEGSMTCFRGLCLKLSIFSLCSRLVKSMGFGASLNWTFKKWRFHGNLTFKQTFCLFFFDITNCHKLILTWVSSSKQKINKGGKQLPTHPMNLCFLIVTPRFALGLFGSMFAGANMGET